MSDLTPTAEQADALAMFGTGASMVIEAGAGTGKTSTLQLLAKSTGRRGRYIAFNRAIVEDVKGRMPDTVYASTAHSLAMKAVGGPYRHRLGSGRMRGGDIARALDIPNIGVTYGAQTKVVDAWLLAGYVMQAVVRYCQTADLEPNVRHVPYIEGIDLPDAATGRRTYTNNNEIAERLLPYVRKAWADICRTDGSLPFRHDHYLKMWQLSQPRAAVDFILFDEAQDANPVLAAVIEAQTHVQRVYVGDRAQAIYGFTGAVDAMSSFETDHRAYLSQSFRFGHAIAEEANGFLAQLDTPLRLTGNPAVTSYVGPFDGDPDALLTRTNATAVGALLDALRRGLRPHIVGGGAEVVRFVEGAQKLKAEGFTTHPDLACFRSWLEVQEYVASDVQGGELRLLVSLVDEFGCDTIIDALKRMPSERSADLVISTAHKSKGREWRRVRLAGDFTENPDNEDEIRLQYVAVTRAREYLDAEALTPAPAAEDF
jgi:hypothetical protein